MCPIDVPAIVDKLLTTVYNVYRVKIAAPARYKVNDSREQIQESLMKVTRRIGAQSVQNYQSATN